jgi:hypothetical protein
MRTFAPEWELEVHRGPGWLFVKLRNPDDDSPHSTLLADQLWSLLESHLVYRLVLDLNEVRVVDRRLLGQLIQLYRRIRRHDGVMRLCGLSPTNRMVLESRHRLTQRLPPYDDIEEAVMGVKRRPR